MIDAVRGAGGAVGLHYETLTRDILRNGGGATAERIEAAASDLRAEIATFKQLFGPIRSICPHGDSRVPGVTNQVLLKRMDPRRSGSSSTGTTPCASAASTSG